jgi:predicted nucleic acid-binding protein
MTGYVIDACALIALLNGEPERDILEKVFTSGLPLRMAAVNVLEVAYDAVRRQENANAGQEILNLLELLGVEVVWTMTPSVLLRASQIKARGRLSLADSIGLALSLEHNARLVTADHHEFDQFERAGLGEYEWIR